MTDVLITTLDSSSQPFISFYFPISKVISFQETLHHKIGSTMIETVSVLKKSSKGTDMIQSGCRFVFNQVIKYYEGEKIVDEETVELITSLEQLPSVVRHILINILNFREEIVGEIVTEVIITKFVSSIQVVAYFKKTYLLIVLAL